MAEASQQANKIPITSTKAMPIPTPVRTVAAESAFICSSSKHPVLYKIPSPGFAELQWKDWGIGAPSLGEKQQDKGRVPSGQSVGPSTPQHSNWNKKFQFVIGSFSTFSCLVIKSKYY